MTRSILACIAFIMLTDCTGSPAESEVKWKSKYHRLEVEYSSPWIKFPERDNYDETLFSLLDPRNGTSYVIKIMDDVSTNVLSNDSYYEANMNMVLESNMENQLLSENDITFHGKIYHRQIFLIHTLKWGLLKQFANFHRNGEHLYSILMSFPVDEENAHTAQLPHSLVALDRKVRINE